MARSPCRPDARPIRGHGAASGTATREGARPPRDHGRSGGPRLAPRRSRYPAGEGAVRSRSVAGCAATAGPIGPRRGRAAPGRCRVAGRGSGAAGRRGPRPVARPGRAARQRLSLGGPVGVGLRGLRLPARICVQARHPRGSPAGARGEADQCGRPARGTGDAPAAGCRRHRGVRRRQHRRLRGVRLAAAPEGDRAHRAGDDRPDQGRLDHGQGRDRPGQPGAAPAAAAGRRRLVRLCLVPRPDRGGHRRLAADPAAPGAARFARQYRCRGRRPWPAGFAPGPARLVAGGAAYPALSRHRRGGGRRRGDVGCGRLPADRPVGLPAGDLAAVEPGIA